LDAGSTKGEMPETKIDEKRRKTVEIFNLPYRRHAQKNGRLQTTLQAVETVLLRRIAVVGGLRRFESSLRRNAHRFEPSADVNLRVCFSAEMAGGRTTRSIQIPFDDRELLVSALDHKPMAGILTDNPANLALKFLQTRHAFSGKVIVP
jgi:hypothetical protein